MGTARDLITLVLSDAGIFTQGTTPAAIDVNNSLTRLNDMLYSWRMQRWLVYHLVDTACACTGAQSYNIGTGQTLNVARPDRLEYGYIRQTTPAAPNQPDWPLELVQSRERYSDITLKQLGSFPRYLFYDAAYPIGKVYPWPLPSNLYELHVLTKDVLQTFADLNTAYAIPENYNEAVRYNLQMRSLMAYNLPVPQEIKDMAKATLNAIKTSNLQMPTLKMPRMLRRTGMYNVFSDQSY